MVKTRFLAIFIFLAGFLAAYFNVVLFLPDFLRNDLFAKIPFHLGLDLQGGAHLVYEADTSIVSALEVSAAMDGLRDVIERRINFFGVSEPIVQIEKSGSSQRLIVELPGVTNIEEAIKLIGGTPYLEFKTQRADAERDQILEAQKNGQRQGEDPYYISTALTGRFLKKAALNFGQTTFEPEISLEFTSDGAKIFADITKNNIGKTVAIYLDGAAISTPNVREEIPNGKAQITGKFTPDEAKKLVARLNSGALPIPIRLVSQQSIGASLGEEVLYKSVKAGLVGILAVSIFLILLYRMFGVVSVFALLIYTFVSLTLYKLIPVTITAPGIAGIVLSIGSAVDANILIFERALEELRNGKTFRNAVDEGFKNAWTSIRDSNISTVITAVILYWFGTSVVKGFALTLGIGVILSLLCSFLVTKTFLKALDIKGANKFSRFLFKIIS